MIEMLHRALVARFFSDAELSRTGRTLLAGLGGEPKKTTLPCVSYDIESGEPRDTFSHDIEAFHVEFVAMTKSENPGPCRILMDHIMRVYDEAVLPSEDLHTVAVQRKRLSGPTMRDGVYYGMVDYEIVVQAVSRTPLLIGE
jgi:hypothetical protein